MGRVRAQPNQETACSHDDSVLFVLVRSGAGSYHCGGLAQRVTQGFAGMILPSPDPGLLVADPRDPYDHYYCRFDGREAVRMASEIAGKRQNAKFFFHPRWAEVVPILEAMLAVERDTPPVGTEWVSQADAGLARLLSLLLCPRKQERTRLTEGGILNYLEAHVSEPLRLTNVAQYFGVSRGHLSRRAHELLGAPLCEVAVTRKLEFARLLLESSTDLEVADIALRVGYTDPLYFSRVFKKHFGLSPSYYRKAKTPAACARHVLERQDIAR